MTGAAVDLAGPLANFIVGAVALALAYRSSAAPRLLLALIAEFNLLWFSLQLVASAATRTDDWAWAMHVFHIAGAERCGMIAFGVLFYLGSIRAVAAALAPFATSEIRVRNIVWIAWLTGGILACVTALFDQHPIPAILHHAAPQSFLLAIGLLFTPRWATRFPMPPAPAIRFSPVWTAAAAIVAVLSILYLGPGFAV
ncbi:MAG TPA: hypothetical protein VIJ85_07010 [Rhizomicrobium sp.]